MNCRVNVVLIGTSLANIELKKTKIVSLLWMFTYANTFKSTLNIFAYVNIHNSEKILVFLKLCWQDRFQLKPH